MKRQIIRLSPLTMCFCLLVFQLCSCSAPDQEDQADREEVNDYDSLLAQKYGADDYGMKTYVMAFLYSGPNRDLDSLRRAELQQKHLENIVRLSEEGKLIMAGPFLGPGDMRGIYIFDVPTLAEAQALTESDPAIQAGSLRMELRQWYGSASLAALDSIHSRLQKKSITN